jgi:hypothetical protein
VTLQIFTITSTLETCCAAIPGDEVREILRPLANRDGDPVHWLVRQIELVRRERLMNEAANSSTGDRLNPGRRRTSALFV